VHQKHLKNKRIAKHPKGIDCLSASKNYLKGACVGGVWRCLSCVYWQLRGFGVLAALLVVHVTTQKAFEATVCFRRVAEEWMKREKE